MAATPDVVERVLTWATSTSRRRTANPSGGASALATVLAIGLSLAADAALVAIGTHLYPATKGY